MDQAVPTLGEPADAPETRLTFAGRTGELYRIFLVNILLTIVTLGIYRFWAKVRYRKYLWARTQLFGEEFEYTGTGKELFFGFLIIAFGVLLPIFAVNTVASLLFGQTNPVAMVAIQLLLYLAIVFLIGVGSYAAIRYRLSRTLWRGIRGGLTGSRIGYGLRFLGYGLLAFVSLGFCVPLMQVRLSRYLFNRAAFGSGQFAFEASTWPLFRRFIWLPILYVLTVAPLIVTALAAIVAEYQTMKTQRVPNDRILPDIVHAHGATLILGMAVSALFLILFIVAYARYRAASLSYIYSHVRYETLRFRFEVTAWRLFRYAAGNLLILLCTLGLGFPVVMMRRVRLVADNLTIVGTADFDAILQNTAPRSRFGEGLASAFDIGAI